MIKSIPYIIAVALLLVACKKEEKAFSIGTDRLNVDAAATIKKVWVKNSSDWNYEIEGGGETWVECQKISGNKADTCVIYIKENLSVDDRNTTVLIGDNVSGAKYGVYILQLGVGRQFLFRPERVIIAREETTTTVQLHMNADEVEVASMPAWVTDVAINKTDSPSTLDIVVTAEPHSEMGFRAGTISFSAYWADVDDTETHDLGVIQLGLSSVESDKNILTDIYNALGGDGWAEDYRWDLDGEITSWKGVSLAAVDQDGGVRVVGLQLTGVGLQGDIPEEVCDLTYLKSLWFNDNEGLTGVIPENIGNLTLMENLRLGSSSITGTIPNSIIAMENAYSISINNTGVEGVYGPIPYGFSNMTYLISLDLSDNALSGYLPEDIGTMVHLRYFDVSNNNLRGTIPNSYLNNLNWDYWDPEYNICPQRGAGFTNCPQ